MFKRFLEKWKIWEQAFLGIDDIQGDQSMRLEARVQSLENQVETLRKANRSNIRVAQTPDVGNPNA